MAAPRSTSLRALRVLSQRPTTPCTRRGLHITGATSAPPASVGDKASLYSARSLSDLKGECQSRKLGVHGTQAELVERLSNHDFLQSRAFSIAMRRINGTASETNSGRQFNTSRSQKAVGDSSTVDFAYMPSMSEMETTAARPDLRIPIFPDLYARPQANLAEQPSGSSGPMRPHVYTVSGAGADVAVSPMTEVVDNLAVDIDPFSLTETVGKSRFEEEMQKQQNGSSNGGVVQELWHGFLDDLLGPKAQPSRRQ
ncbi:hypothetical protein BDW42DRAFT_174056 [Aspergillus taichungensis]|uniref:SAP domain-containing protein n=1 Tax=Aspergillus taichungensis TaxID=482145 RepID=A0A2J5HP52_9EURO|nr:hypothetical protein BDW42DRAFT_174056 [Aspergillus taichungensis]